MKYCYKIVNSLSNHSGVIDTKASINKNRTNRYNELVRYFQYIYEFSYEKKMPIGQITNDLSPYEFFIPVIMIHIDNDYFPFIERIKQIQEEINFDWSKREFSHFIEYIFEKVRLQLNEEMNLNLPSRFESSYFFESKDNCRKYVQEKNLSHVKIIKVEILNSEYLLKLDNSLLNYFPNDLNAVDLENQAKKYWLGETSENSFYEIIFQGRYKVLK